MAGRFEMNINALIWLLVVFVSNCIEPVLAFQRLVPLTSRTATQLTIIPKGTLLNKFEKPTKKRSITRLFTICAKNQDHESMRSDLDVVLFGLGDLRVDDHVGLHRALLSGTAKQVLPICIMDENSLSNFPGVMAHTLDTARCIHAALRELSEEITALTNLYDENEQFPNLQSLQVRFPHNRSLADCLRENIVQTLANSGNDNFQPKVRVHVCDLGPADNQIGYGPYRRCMMSEHLHNITGLEIVPWTQDLRKQPWDEVESLPVEYPDYEKQYVKGKLTLEPTVVQSDERMVSLSTREIHAQAGEDSSHDHGIPSLEDIVQILTGIAANRNILISRDGINRVQAEASSGLYLTHWGGIVPDSTLGCRSALRILQCYAQECKQDDVTWFQNPLYPGRAPFVTPKGGGGGGKSLEHSAMIWQLAGDGTSPFGKPDNNWLAGEAMVRFLATPLLLGTISARRVWHESRKLMQKQPSLFFVPPLESMVEAREWHRLLAARNIMCEPHLYNDFAESPTHMHYRYWRYQGFLCRYSVMGLIADKAAEHPMDNILLVHGFGASGTQWKKTLDAITELQGKEQPLFRQGLAPDLIGFGQSEKPAMSYTGYMWDSQVLDFLKECAIPRHNWSHFVVGGNSIGGYTSMSLAASDTATVEQMNPIPRKQQDRRNLVVNSNGAPGTNLCRGLILMNSAGPIKTREEIQQEKDEAKRAIQEDVRNRLPLYSVAQVTAMNALPVCRPPWRPFARAFGAALLAYLRPNIQSICVRLYPSNPSAVDDALCDSISRDSLDPGAINVMMAGAKLPVPRTANELLESDFRLGSEGGDVSIGKSNGAILESTFDGPVLIAQGVLDPLNDAQDRLERFGALRKGIVMNAIPLGHCPHDERPDLVAQSVLSWWEKASKENVPTKSTPGESVELPNADVLQSLEQR